METVNVYEAKTHLSKLLRRVARGEQILITRRGVVVARLCAPEPAESRTPGLLSGRVDDAFFEPLDDDELDEWE